MTIYKINFLNIKLLVALIFACQISLSARPNLGFFRDKDRAQVDEISTVDITNARQGSLENCHYFFKEANKNQTFALYLPSAYNTAQEYPLVVALHGLGATPQKIMGYKGLIPEAEKRGYIIVAPFGYNDHGWYGSQGHGKNGLGFGKPEDPSNLGELSEIDVMNVLKLVQDSLSIDPTKIFLLGHSMGGAGVLHLGATYPSKWAGLACLAPAFKGSTSQVSKIKHLPVFMKTGDRDRLVRVRFVRKWADAMKTYDVNLTYGEIKGGNHFGSISNNPSLLSEVFDFFDLY